MQLPEVYFLICALLFFALDRFGYWLDCRDNIPEDGDAIKLSLVPISATEPAA